MHHHPAPLLVLRQATNTIKGATKATTIRDTTSILSSSNHRTISSLHLHSSTCSSQRTLIGGQARAAEDCWGNFSVEAASPLQVQAMVDTEHSLAMVATVQVQGITANNLYTLRPLKVAAVEWVWLGVLP